MIDLTRFHPRTAETVASLDRCAAEYRAALRVLLSPRFLATAPGGALAWDPRIERHVKGNDIDFWGILREFPAEDSDRRLIKVACSLHGSYFPPGRGRKARPSEVSLFMLGELDWEEIDLLTEALRILANYDSRRAHAPDLAAMWEEHRNWRAMEEDDAHHA